MTTNNWEIGVKRKRTFRIALHESNLRDAEMVLFFRYTRAYENTFIYAPFLLWL